MGRRQEEEGGLELEIGPFLKNFPILLYFKLGVFSQAFHSLRLRVAADGGDTPFLRQGWSSWLGAALCLYS